MPPTGTNGRISYPPAALKPRRERLRRRSPNGDSIRQYPSLGAADTPIYILQSTVH
jgi:hypothetical protein